MEWTDEDPEESTSGEALHKDGHWFTPGETLFGIAWVLLVVVVGCWVLTR